MPPAGCVQAGQVGLGGGTTVKLAGGYLAAGAINGFNVVMFGVAGTPGTTPPPPAAP